MDVVKKIVPLVLVGVVVCSWSNFAFAAQNIDVAKVQDNRKKLIETSSCPGCELAGVNLSGVNLDRVNLTGANLEGANLAQARLHLATLNKANLQNADLRDVEFGGADLGEADLRGANLQGATFVGAYLIGTQFDMQVASNQPSEKMASGKTPVQEGQGVSSVMEKRDDTARVDTQQQSPVDIKGTKTPSPAAEPGFFDKTMDSVKGLFGQGKSDGDKAAVKETVVTGKTTEITPAPVVQALPQNDAAAKITSAKPSSTEVKGNKTPVPSAEPGFFDKTLDSVKGLFGQGKSDENKAVVKETVVTGKTTERVPAAAPVAQTLPPNDTAVTIAKESSSVEVKGTKTPSPSAEPGFFDKTMDSVKGLFGQGESENKAVAGKHDGDIQREKQLQGNKMTGAQVSENKIDPAAEKAQNKERLLETKHCYGCNLTGVDLAGKNMDSTDLEGADLTGSRLEGVDLENANLKGAILVKANLRNADLRKADLYKANLSGADLTGAKLDGALLDDTQLSDTVGYQGRQ